MTHGKSSNFIFYPLLFETSIYAYLQLCDEDNPVACFENEVCERYAKVRFVHWIDRDRDLSYGFVSKLSSKIYTLEFCFLTRAFVFFKNQF